MLEVMEQRKVEIVPAKWYDFKTMLFVEAN